jgi:kinesin family protein 2/24
LKIQAEEEGQMNDLIKQAHASRTTHSTVSNEVSSRSHAICQILVQSKDQLIGKLTLVDLAGSERAQDTQENDKNRRQEGADINKR